MNRKRLSFWRNLMGVQKTFDKVIDGRFYTESSFGMCDSLKLAHSYGVISKEELDNARRAIKAYLGDYIFLETKLYHYGLPHEFPDRLAIYRDWKNRPSLKWKRWG